MGICIIVSKIASYKSIPNASYKDESFIGVQISYSGIGYASIDSMHSLVFGSQITGPGFYETLGLPLLGLSPIPGSLAHLFSTPFNSYIFSMK